MRAGTENRMAVLAMVVLAPVAAFLFVRMLVNWESPATAAPPVAATTQAPTQGRSAQRVRRGPRRTAQVMPETLDPTLRLDLLRTSEGTQYEGSGRNIFRAEQEVAEIPKPVESVIREPERTGPPQPPPISLKFFGFASRPGEPKRVFLAQDGDVFIAAEGEIVNRRYRVLRIGNTSVEVEDVFTNQRQTLPMTAS